MLTNLSKGFYILVALHLILSTGSLAQDGSWTRPKLTSSWDEYRKQVKEDTAKKMVELRSRIPGIVYDLRYATVNNFMRRLMYPAGTNTTYLRWPAVKALQKVQNDLNAAGLGLKIYDAYRPFSVTVKFWDLVKDERYVANPSKGSGHNRGTAVDLTIINLSTGKEMDMGTGFDNFSDSAHHSYTNFASSILQNRSLLKSTMEKYGFKSYAEEWWHYGWSDGKQYEILDLDFKKLKKDL